MMNLDYNKIINDIDLVTKPYRKCQFRNQDQNLRISQFIEVLKQHPNAALECCADEYTGYRYEKTKCRKGRCKKIGKGKGYQLWAVW